jgi:ribosomal protein S14
MAALDTTAPNGAGAEADDASLRRRIARGNALELLRGVACPRCNAPGDFQLFENANNNGVGIQCRACGRPHPFIGQGVMWLPQDPDKKRRPPNDIVAVAKERGDHCWGCGTPFAVLSALGIGVHVHHTRPYAEHGDGAPKIPTCALP